MDAPVREPVIEVRGLVNRFGRHVVHQGLDLAVERDEILGLVGGSGTGKSVLLRHTIGLHRPDDGDMLITAAWPVDKGLRSEADEEQVQDRAFADAITVTGSNIKRADLEGPSPVVMIDRQEIERSGVATTAELLREVIYNNAGVRDEIQSRRK